MSEKIDLLLNQPWVEITVSGLDDENRHFTFTGSFSRFSFTTPKPTTKWFPINFGKYKFSLTGEAPIVRIMSGSFDSSDNRYNRMNIDLKVKDNNNNISEHVWFKFYNVRCVNRNIDIISSRTCTFYTPAAIFTSNWEAKTYETKPY